MTCQKCGAAMETQNCRPCRAAYMRVWNAKHRERLADIRHEKQRALIAAGVESSVPCRRCGRVVRLTPALIVGRIKTCSPCLTAKNKARYNATYKAKHPEKAVAKNEVQKAVMRGDLVPQPCEVCGAAKTQAHHDDYSRPLDVRWLCVNCHRLEHLRLKGMVA